LKQSSRSSLKRDLADLSEHHTSAKRSRSAGTIYFTDNTCSSGLS